MPKKWFELRQIWNELSHEHEDDLSESSTILNKIYKQTGSPISYFTRIDDYAVVITVYIPDGDHFQGYFKTRRKKHE